MKKQPEITDATRKNILNAFWTVYQQKPIDRITIKDISDTAHVHRSTFYRYFTDVYDLLDQFEKNILDDIKTTLEITHGTQEVVDLISHAGVIVGALKGYAPAIYHLTSPDGDPRFRSKLRELMYTYFSQFPFSENHSQKSEYLFNFIYTNILANLNFWYANRDKYSLEQIVNYSKLLVSDGIAKYVNGNG